MSGPRSPDTTPVKMTSKQVGASAQMHIKKWRTVFVPITNILLKEEYVESTAVSRYQTCLNKATVESPVEGASSQQRWFGSERLTITFLPFSRRSRVVLRAVCFQGLRLRRLACG